ncbi:MAG: S8 family serine peptidase [Clostridia bacterium]|nr:S8 family serine peptidase [Clostridia bacterium]
MKANLSKNLMTVCLIAVLAVAMLLVPIFGGAAYGLDYGDKTSEDLWFFGGDALNIEGARSVVNGWDKSKLSPVIIAVADTGIDLSHDLFNGVLYSENGEVVGYNSRTGKVAKGNELADNAKNSEGVSEKHGNSVAGVIAMEIKELGLQDYIKIYPIKANSIKGNDETNTFAISSIVNAIKKAHEIGADVLNLSLGILESEITSGSNWKSDSDLLYAIESAREDMLIVAAAGNGKTDGSDSAKDRFYPAATDGVFSVMGYGKNGEIFKTSNYGAAYDVAAPGQEIYTADKASGTYHTLSGTSVAAPSASFAAALLKLRYQAEGRAALNGSSVYRMLKNLSSRVTTKGNYAIRCLDFHTVLTQDFDNTVYNYSAPKSLEFSHNGPMGTGYDDVNIYMHATKVTPVTFIAKINPYGEVSPDLYDSIEWVLRLGVTEDAEEKVIGKGGRFEFTPEIYGETQIYARLKYGEREFMTKEQGINIVYAPYLVGEVRVTYAANAHDNVKDAPSHGVLYTTETTTFSLTGIEYVDRTKTIKWFVNGEQVATGITFDFKPSKSGKYTITAQYDNNPVINTTYVFTADVKPFIARPLDLSMLVIGLALVIIAGTVAVVVVVKKKRAYAAVSNVVIDGNNDTMDSSNATTDGSQE